MARTVKDADLGTRSARGRLATRKKPYYRLIMQGLHLGYYRGQRAGTWSARRFLGEGRYEERKLGLADDVADPDGAGILSFSQAQERARSWFSRSLKGDAELEISDPYTVADALDDYERDYLRRGGKALTRQRLMVNAHIRPALGPVELRRLNKKQIENWLDTLANTPPRLRSRTGSAPKHRERDDSVEGVRKRRETANRVLTILKAALNLAYQNGKVSSRAAWEPIKPYRNVGAPKIRYLTEKETQRLIASCPSPFRELVLGALFTGARYGELAALQVGDFDSLARTVHIRQSKSGKARHVHLTDEGTAFVARLAADRSPSSLLFLRHDGAGWGEAHQVRLMREASKAASVEPPISFHVLRHTYASRLAMRGVALNVIAAQLGHSDTRMTERHYAHLAPSYIGETIRAGFGKLEVGA